VFAAAAVPAAAKELKEKIALANELTKQNDCVAEQLLRLAARSAPALISSPPGAYWP